MAVNGASIAYAVGGGLILYSGIKGATISDTVKAVLSGNLSVTSTEPITSGSSTAAPATGSTAAGDTGAANPSAAQNQALAKQLATQMGHSDWTTGQQWADWVSQIGRAHV